MSAIDDAAVLYLALNGWGEPIACRHIPAEDNLDTCDRDDIVAISSEDGSPLCTEHAKPEHGEIVHMLDDMTLREIKILRLAKYKEAGEVDLHEPVKEPELHWQDDKPDMWSPSIEAAFPTRSGSHDEYAKAMEMISHRHSKHSLVALVNWLLLRAKRHEYVQVSGIGHCAICGSDLENDGNHMKRMP